MILIDLTKFLRLFNFYCSFAQNIYQLKGYMIHYQQRTFRAQIYYEFLLLSTQLFFRGKVCNNLFQFYKRSNYIKNLFQMEETIKKLKQFFNEISWSETEVDQYRVKLFSIHGGRKKIFLAIDEECKGEITSNDICQFCSVRGIKVTEKTSEIIGRYFRNWNQSITYEEFSQVVKPKTFTHQSEEIQIQDPIKIFVKMVSVVIKSFNNLQCIRKEIAENSEHIIRYFAKKYGQCQGINKQNLRQFMLDHNFFTKTKFSQVSGYIFGQTEIQIPWSNFLNIRKQVKWQTLPQQKEDDDIKLIQSYFPSRNQSRVTSKANESRVKSSRAKQQSVIETRDKNERTSTIEEVLGQIEEIQRTLKQRKLRSQVQAQQADSHRKVRQDFVGKVVSRSSKKQVDPQPVSHSKQNDIDEAQYIYCRSKPKYRETDQNKSLKRYNSTQKMPTRTLTNSVSQAQLKIDEIERRAMDKFLSSRRQSYLPQDYHVPYYYMPNRLNLELTRQFGIEMHETGKIRKISAPHINPNYPIFSRNNVIRIPYSNYQDEILFRPISPRLLRY